jgi:hypothetical protein
MISMIVIWFCVSILTSVLFGAIVEFGEGGV